MVAQSILEGHYDPHIRKIDLTRDLSKIADLIEMCFPIASDPDGQKYVNQMRKSAREMRMVSWLSQIAEMGKVQASGFVWEENDQIIGNLSLIPYRPVGFGLTMIANVAVHPDYRRRGIAKALTRRALSHLRRRNANRVWLQVRDDNAAAIALYHALGFKARAYRTTWRIKPKALNPYEEELDPNITLKRHRPAYWSAQKTWLEIAYPRDIRWNLPVNFSRFTPGLFQKIVNALDGMHHRHWSIGHKDEFCGVITWQKTDTYANNLWLAISEEHEDKVLQTALVKVCKKLSQRHSLSIDYPAGRFSAQFRALGFGEFRTLIWMEVNL